MIYTVIADYRKLIPEALLERGIFSLLPENIRAHVDEPKSEEVRLSRAGGYILLYHVVRFLFGNSFELNISFTDDGKPLLVHKENEENIAFNISHSGGLCAVCLSDDGGSVGVDIQEKIDDEKALHIKDRFLSHTIPEMGAAEPVYLFGAFAPDGNCMFAEIPYQSLKKGDPSTDLTDKWSLTEAIVKCDGRGICKKEEIVNSLCGYSYETVKLCYKGISYSISTVKN